MPSVTRLKENYSIVSHFKFNTFFGKFQLFSKNFSKVFFPLANISRLLYNDSEMKKAGTV